MKTSSDVNTLFAYGDDIHPLHNKVCLYMARNIRGKYILLAKVKSNFIYTYKEYLTTSCIIIDKSIRDFKERLKKSPSQTYKPSPLAISANVDKLINENIQEMSSTMEFNSRETRKFVTKLLSEYSVPTLLEKERELGEFREKYLTNAEENALEILNKFIRHFRSREFELMNIEQYSSFDEWLKKIKNSKKEVFKNKQDYEDMVIAAEFLAYNKEIGLLSFFTCDKDCQNSIKDVAKEYQQQIGKVDLII